MSNIFDFKKYAINEQAEKMSRAINSCEEAYRIISDVCESGFAPDRLSMIRDMLKAAIYDADDKFAELFDDNVRK